MTAEEAIDILDRCCIGDCELCTKNEKHGGHCEGSNYAFSAIAEAQKALDKQIPKKPRETRYALMCASCGHKITEKGCKKLYRNYCKKCGQRLLWEGEND